MGVGAIVDLGDFADLAVAQEYDEQAVVRADPVFAGLALQDLPDLARTVVEDLRGGHVDGLDQEDLPGAGGGKHPAVFRRLDVGQAVGERRRVEAVAPLVEVEERAVVEDHPHGIVGVNGDLGGAAARESVFLDASVLFYIAVYLVAGDPDVALEVRLEVKGGRGAQQAERFGVARIGVVVAHAGRGREPDQAVLVLADVHAGQVGHQGGARFAGAAEIVAVEAGQAVARADPDESEAVLVGAMDGIGREAFVGGIMLKIIVRSRLQGRAKEAGQ